jgi:hypothetical protein
MGLVEGWAAAEVQGARLDDQRRRPNMARLWEALAEHPGKSFSAALGDTLRQAAYGLCSQSGCTPDDLLAGHVQQTAHRAVAAGRVVVAQDTVRFDYYTHRGCSGLGPVGKQANSYGLFGHAALALSTAGLPLGVLHLALWARDPAAFGSRHQRRKRTVEEKESGKWLTALTAVEEALPATLPVVLVQDREAEIYRFFTQPRRPQTDLIVRAFLRRRVLVLGEDPDPARPEIRVPLPQAWEHAPVRTQLTVTVPAAPGRQERTAEVEVRSVRVRIPRTRAVKAADAPASVELWAVWAREVDPPAGVSPLQWLLVTTLPAGTAAAAAEVVRLYGLRWKIERLHYVLKSGLKVEQLQIDDDASLKNALAGYYVVAWRLLYLTYRARLEPDLAASTCLSASELAVLAAKYGQAPRTLQEAIALVARLGGIRKSRRSAEPGVKALWEGIRDLERLVEGWELARHFFAPTDPSYDTS